MIQKYGSRLAENPVWYDNYSHYIFGNIFMYEIDCHYTAWELTDGASEMFFMHLVSRTIASVWCH